jgi:hypothetical protein
MIKKPNINKKILIPIIFTVVLILAATGTVFLAGMSGLAINTTANSTFGEKSISIDSLHVLNNSTADTYEYNGTKYFYLDGYVQNNNEYDAFNIEMNATAYDEYGNIVSTNATVYLYSKNIPAGGLDEFYVEFPDPDNRTVRIEVNVVDAKSEL